MRCGLCIPTLNAASAWPELWSGLERQSVQPSEVSILDSSSTDGTRILAKKSGCRVIKVPSAEFRHGGTRQLAAELTPETDVLVYLTQDAILADANALSALLAAFSDDSVGATYGRQLPRPLAKGIEAHARLFNYPPQSAVRSLENVSSLGFRTIFFSNSFGAYRKAALNQVGGFPRESNFGEDTVVAARLIQHGWRIAYAADATVYHSHALSLREEFRRYYAIGRLHSAEPWLLRDFGQVTGEGRSFVLSEMRYLARHAPWSIPEALLRSALKGLAYTAGRNLRTRETP